MDSIELLTLVIAGALLVLAAVSAWIESGLERRDAPNYRRVLRQERGYREHVARGPVVERRRIGRQRVPREGLLAMVWRQIGAMLASAASPPAPAREPEVAEKQAAPGPQPPAQDGT